MVYLLNCKKCKKKNYDKHNQANTVNQYVYGDWIMYLLDTLCVLL